MVSEREIIELFNQFFKEPPYSAVPFGDDVSAIKIEDNRVSVLKVDMFVRETDALPEMTLQQMGWKAVVSTVSDLASKGLQPLALLLSLGLPYGTTKNEVINLASGIRSAAEEYGTYVVGGDTNQASDLILDIVGYGVAKQPLMLRSGAKLHDIVATTGCFGNTAASYKILLEELNPPLNIRRQLLKSVYKPRAHLKQGLALKESRSVTSCIDSSDGLAWSLYELSKSSKVGFQLTSIPMEKELLRFAELFKLNPINLALYGGEEYNLVLTVRKELWKDAVNAIKNVGGQLFKIGTVIEAPKISLLTNKGEQPIKNIGWEHLKKR